MEWATHATDRTPGITSRTIKKISSCCKHCRKTFDSVATLKVHMDAPNIASHRAFVFSAQFGRQLWSFYSHSGCYIGQRVLNIPHSCFDSLVHGYILPLWMCMHWILIWHVGSFEIHCNPPSIYLLLPRELHWRALEIEGRQNNSFLLTGNGIKHFCYGC